MSEFLESVSDLVWMNDIGELINEKSNQLKPIYDLLKSFGNLCLYSKRNNLVNVRKLYRIQVNEGNQRRTE